jgi:predicted O-methyltransferase YrrM
VNTEYQFAFLGQVIRCKTGYLRELREIIERRGANRVLEWGSGLTTMMLAEMGCHVTSIDHDDAYQRAVKGAISPDHVINVEWACCDLDGDRRSERDRGLTYSTYPLSRRSDVLWDLIIIDGRRRLECALVAAKVSDPGTVILLHDWRRERYRLARELFSVKEEGHWLVMRKKAGVL